MNVVAVRTGLNSMFTANYKPKSSNPKIKFISFMQKVHKKYETMFLIESYNACAWLIYTLQKIY